MRRHLPTGWKLLLVLACVTGNGIHAARAEKPGFFGIGSKTLGGAFVWSDEIVFHEWRIQRNAIVGHYRLIDGKDRRETFGSLKTCLEALDGIKTEQKLSPMPPDVVIVLHGLGAARQMMDKIADYLSKTGGLEVVNIGYPSTIDDIDTHARSLASVIRNLDGAKRISFVAHSMGNIVIRRYLHDLEKLPPNARPRVQFQRFVMIAPPNHGAMLADRMKDNSLAKFAAGKPLDQLAPGTGWEELEPKLATPDFEFGIIAGGRGSRDGYLATLPGDDDGLLTVKTTKLAGATDFVLIKGIHQFLPMKPQVREATLRYLKNGFFISANARRPLPPEPAAARTP